AYCVKFTRWQGTVCVSGSGEFGNGRCEPVGHNERGPERIANDFAKGCSQVAARSTVSRTADHEDDAITRGIEGELASAARHGCGSGGVVGGCGGRVRTGSMICESGLVGAKSGKTCSRKFLFRGQPVRVSFHDFHRLSAAPVEKQRPDLAAAGHRK